MIVELGHFVLILAFVISIIQVLFPLWGSYSHNERLISLAEPAATSQFILLLAAFMALTYAFVTSDFSVANVYENSHSLKPMLYKVSGVWGNHEGSLLFWSLILALFGACVAWFGKGLSPLLRARVIAIQGLNGVAFLSLLIFTSNPFLRLENPPLDGLDLNPLLQDPGLAFHPPFLYLGYVGLSMAYSFAIAALLEGRVDAAWGRWVRPWTLAAWVFLTIGIGLGSWWAYYELGWGGFWFWDPVENASLMPWLFTTALLHSAIVVEKRESLKAWTILLSILAFGFSLIGTFIVRSGVITSVHSFASDPERGLFILAILALFTGGGLVLFTWRMGALEAKGIFAMISRESALVVNNLLLSIAAFVVFIGTIWPLLAELFFARKLSVGEPFFNTAFSPFVIILALILPIGAILPWKRANVRTALKKLFPVMALAVSVGLLFWAMETNKTALAPIGGALGIWVVLGSAMDLWQKTGKSGLKNRLMRLRSLPRAEWGRVIAHTGFGVAILSICIMLSWKDEVIEIVAEGERFSLGEYEISLKTVENVSGPNYQSARAEMDIYQDGKLVGSVFPEKRFYPVAQIPTTEAAISYGIFEDLYLVLGDPQERGGWAVRGYIHPLVNWLWGGVLLMAAGGLFSLSDRRYRAGYSAARKGV